MFLSPRREKHTSTHTSAHTQTRTCRIRDWDATTRHTVAPRQIGTDGTRQDDMPPSRCYVRHRLDSKPQRDSRHPEPIVVVILQTFLEICLLYFFFVTLFVLQLYPFFAHLLSGDRTPSLSYCVRILSKSFLSCKGTSSRRCENTRFSL